MSQPTNQHENLSKFLSSHDHLKWLHDIERQSFYQVYCMRYITCVLFHCLFKLGGFHILYQGLWYTKRFGRQGGPVRRTEKGTFTANLVIVLGLLHFACFQMLWYSELVATLFSRCLLRPCLVLLSWHYWLQMKVTKMRQYKY